MENMPMGEFIIKKMRVEAKEAIFSMNSGAKEAWNERLKNNKEMRSPCYRPILRISA